MATSRAKVLDFSFVNPHVYMYSRHKHTYTTHSSTLKVSAAWIKIYKPASAHKIKFRTAPHQRRVTRICIIKRNENKMAKVENKIK